MPGCAPMPEVDKHSENIDEMNKTIDKLRDEVATLRETVNMLLELVVEADEGEYEEAATNPWELMISQNQGFKGMGM